MKEAGTQHWKYPNTGATNSSGFTGLPGAGRGTNRANQSSMVFNYLGQNGYFWSSSRSPMENSAYSLVLFYDHAWANLNSYNNFDGFSIRLVQDK